MQRIFGSEYKIKMSIETFRLRYPSTYVLMNSELMVHILQSTNDSQCLYLCLLIFRQLYATCGSDQIILENLQKNFIEILHHPNWKCRILASEVVVKTSHVMPAVLIAKIIKNLGNYDQNYLQTGLESLWILSAHNSIILPELDLKKVL